MMPAERLRLRAWIEKQADSGKLPGLEWDDREKGIFKVSWKHASRQCWSYPKDACVFEGWAIHSGRYRKGHDRPDPRRWKANFRCALNALPDIVELPNQGIARGQDAYKVYQIVKKTAKKDLHNKRQNKAPTACASTSTATTPNVTPPTREHSSAKRAARSDPGPMRNRQNIGETPRKAPYYPLSGTKPFNGFGFWPTFHTWPHLLDHDYMTPWFDPRPEMKDIGVMTQPGIKQEPLSPDDGMMPSCSRDLNELDESSTEGAKVIVKEEDEVPSDQEIIDLVDQMSEQSGSSLDEMEGMEGSNDPEQEFADESSSSKKGPPLQLVLKSEGSTNYGNEYSATLPLTPDSTREILSVINRS